ncbi:hypothetical protein BC567DRAFT_225269 [Phyllosticta citribraziliensis]
MMSGFLTTGFFMSCCFVCFLAFLARISSRTAFSIFSTSAGLSKGSDETPSRSFSSPSSATCLSVATFLRFMAASLGPGTGFLPNLSDLSDFSGSFGLSGVSFSDCFGFSGSSTFAGSPSSDGPETGTLGFCLSCALASLIAFHFAFAAFFAFIFSYTKSCHLAVCEKDR